MTTTIHPDRSDDRVAHTDHDHATFRGSGEAAAIHALAVDRLLRFDPEVVTLATELTTTFPGMPMAHTLMAYLSLLGTDPADLPGARADVAVLATAPDLTPHEQAHLDALSAWAEGDWSHARQAIDALLVEWPTDLLALAVGHQLDFFLGDAAELRDRPGRSLARLAPDHPHRGFVLGMQAFGLEESGHYAQAEVAGLAALEAEPRDVWALHAVTHVFEMLGRVDDGIRFMESRTDDWGNGNLFTIHNWWHLALYHLDLGHHETVLRIYDERVHHDGSAGVPIELLDASALLGRLAIDGVDTGTRFADVASAWESKVPEASWYAFNDVHAVLAFAGAGRMEDARSVVGGLEHFVASGPDPRRTNVEMVSTVGLPVATAIVDFFDGRHDAVVDTLLPIRRLLARFGGSHAQRDLFARMLLQSALLAGRTGIARALVDERLALRPSGRFALERRSILDDGRLTR